MRTASCAADPESPPRTVTLPAAWEESAAEALAALAPGSAAASLPAAAAVWIGTILQRAKLSGEPGDLAHDLHLLLRQRRAAPNAAVWLGEAGAAPGFVLNLAAFHNHADGFDIAGYEAAATTAARACRTLAPHAARYEIGLSGLDDLLAALGLDYAGPAAREIAACLAALLRARVDLALEGDQGDLLAAPAIWPAPPRHCAIPGLADAAAAARARVFSAPGAPDSTGVFPPGAPEALLGVETGGIAPAFSPVRHGCLTRAAQSRLAAIGLSPDAALARALLGDNPLPVPDLAAHAAMHEAVAPYLHATPPHPTALPAPDAAFVTARAAEPAGRRPLPARHAGLSQKASVDGHPLYLRTGEYEDGRLGEISLVAPRETPAFRALLEAFAQAVSMGLQHGVTLEEWIDAFALSRFGPAGVVEGDPAVSRASSVLDYVMRTLSVNYLGRPLPEASVDAAEAVGSEAPLLPLDLPQASPRARRRALRVVG